MNYYLKITTNEKIQKYNGLPGQIQEIDNRLIFTTMLGAFRTSPIMCKCEDDSEVIYTTENSSYTFGKMNRRVDS